MHHILKALGKETGDLSALANPESVDDIPSFKGIPFQITDFGLPSLAGQCNRRAAKDYRTAEIALLTLTLLEGGDNTRRAYISM